MAPVEIAKDLFFIQRGYLKANHFVWRGERPVLIDTGYKADFTETVRKFQALGVDPATVGLIVNTHTHCDHVGGNRRIQEASGCEIALHRIGKHFIDQRDDWSTWWRYYGQKAEFFTCTRALEDGDLIDVGPHRFQVLYTPGHAADGIVLYCPTSRILISSDTLWQQDMAVMTLAVEGSRALFDMADSIEKIAGLDVETVYPGHGPPFSDFAGAVARCRQRIRRFLTDPEAVGADVMKKIMIYTLLMYRQVPAERFFDLIRSAPWFDMTAQRYFTDDRYGVFQRFFGELKERGLILEKDGVLTTPVQP
jgi:glyoxylase-like metal-dependent hydrolase (beta-lactamase superfamily II)